MEGHVWIGIFDESLKDKRKAWMQENSETEEMRLEMESKAKQAKKDRQMEKHKNNVFGKHTTNDKRQKLQQDAQKMFVKWKK